MEEAETKVGGELRLSRMLKEGRAKASPDGSLIFFRRVLFGQEESIGSEDLMDLIDNSIQCRLGL